MWSMRLESYCVIRTKPSNCRQHRGWNIEDWPGLCLIPAHWSLDLQQTTILIELKCNGQVSNSIIIPVCPEHQEHWRTNLHCSTVLRAGIFKIQDTKCLVTTGRWQVNCALRWNTVMQRALEEVVSALLSQFSEALGCSRRKPTASATFTHLCSSRGLPVRGRTTSMITKPLGNVSKKVHYRICVKVVHRVCLSVWTHVMLLRDGTDFSSRRMQEAPVQVACREVYSWTGVMDSAWGSYSRHVAHINTTRWRDCYAAKGWTGCSHCSESGAETSVKGCLKINCVFFSVILGKGQANLAVAHRTQNAHRVYIYSI